MSALRRSWIIETSRWWIAPALAVTAMGCSKLNTAFKTVVGSVTTSSTASFGTLSFNPSSVNFGSISAGSSGAATVTATNVGMVQLVGLATPTVTGSGYTLSSTTCASTLEVGASCTVSVKFAPPYNGGYSGIVTFSGTNLVSITLPLSGSGTSSSLTSVTPAGTDFGTVFVGQTTLATFGVQNTGLSSTGALTISTTDSTVFPISGDTCTGNTLAVGASCQFTVTFTPQASSSYSAQALITDSGNGLSTAAGMVGVGVVPALSISPSPYSYGGMVIGGNASQLFTITNSSAIAVSGLSVSAIGSGFSVASNGCSAYSSGLPAGASCPVTVKFSPPSSGSFNGFVAASATSQPTVTASVSGSAASAANLSLAPSSWAFGTTFASLSPTKVFTLSNSGGANATGLSISLSDTTNYSVSDNCSGSVGGNGNCQVTLTYHPTDQNSHPLTLTASYNTGLVPTSTTATASGTGRYPPVLSFDVTSYDYGYFTVGNSLKKVFTLSNTGQGYASSLTYTTTDPSYYISSNTCPTSGNFNSGATCQITVEFSPMRIQSYTQALQVDYAERSTLGNSVLSSTLRGTGANGITWNLINELGGTASKPFYTASGEIWFPGAYGVVHHSPDGGTTWERQTIGNYSILYSLGSNGTDLFAMNSTNGMYKNVGSGKFWQVLSPTSYVHRMMECPTASSCIAGGFGSNNHSMTTADGGASWTERASNADGGSQTYDISAVDASTSFETSGTAITVSKDGGASHQVLFGNVPLRYVTAPSSSVVYAAGDSGWIRKSTDGGSTWVTVPIPTESDVYGMACASATLCWTAFANGSIYNTSDGGSTWTLQTTLSITPYGIAAPSSSVIYVVGTSGKIYKSTDGGSTWPLLQTVSAGVTLQGIKCVSTTSCALYTNSSILITQDGNTFFEGPITSATGEQIAVSGANVWVGSSGGLGSLRKSTDGGSTWSAIPAPLPESFPAIAFADANNGWIGSSSSGKIFSTSDGGSTWTQQTVPTSLAIYRMQFLNSTTGFAVGSNGLMLKTSNGGSTWTQVSGVGGLTLDSIFCLDTSNCWTGNTSGTIYKTTNGGSSWTSVAGPAAYPVVSIYFKDSNNGYASVTNGASSDTLWVTTNGGASWSVGASGIKNAGGWGGIRFTSDGTKGVIVSSGNVIKYSSDGGSTWTAATAPSYPYSSIALGSHHIHDVAITDESVPSAIKMVATTQYGAILLSTNSGATWTQMNVGDIYVFGSFGFDATNSNNLFFTYILSSGLIYLGKSTDAGLSATAASTSLNNSLIQGYGMQVIDSNRVIFSGGSFSDQIYRTANGGSSWSTVSLSPAYSAKIYGFGLVNGTGTVVAAGSYGTLWLSTDYGATWSLQTPTLGSYNINGLKFISTTQGWAVCDNGKIFATSDGGLSWAAQTSGTANNLMGVDFVDANTGYAVGYNGTALKTTNGGSTWSSMSITIPSYRSNSLRRIRLKDANTGIATAIDSSAFGLSGGTTWSDISRTLPPGLTLYRMVTLGRGIVYAAMSSGVFAKTTDGGQSWTLTQLTGNPTLSSLYFVNANTGWAVSNSTLKVYATTDGGATWTTQYTAAQALNDIFCASATRCWAVGNAGLIATTSNGSTWSAQTVGASAFNGVSGASGTTTAWGVGAGGVMYKTTDGTSWTSQTSGTASTLTSIAMLNSTQGWAVGASGTILVTTNGTSWSAQTSGTTNQLNHVTVLDSTHAMTVGASSTILTTTNGGTTWLAPSYSISSNLGTGTFYSGVMTDSVMHFVGGYVGGLVLFRSMTGGAAP